MKCLLKKLKRFIFNLSERGMEAEQKKAAKKWDSIVEELKNRK
tara:strand:+ start:196 stop:324 length:129 start_codon:yes stop_codon:yes gene_type:complete